MTRSTGDLEAINLDVDSVASSPGTTRVSALKLIERMMEKRVDQ